MEHHGNKPSGHVGTRTCVAGLSQQTCYAQHHHASLLYIYIYICIYIINT